MNREIKFRGKSADNGEWIIGDLIQYESGEMAIFGKKLSRYGYEATEILNRSKVLSETIGQFTGLSDKNGKEIYEGDIIKTKKYGKCVEDKNFSGYDYFQVKFKNGGFYLENGERCFHLIDGSHDEVCNNIYDNPELIKEE